MTAVQLLSNVAILQINISSLKFNMVLEAFEKEF